MRGREGVARLLRDSTNSETSSKEMVLVETTPQEETYRERLRTAGVALDLDSGEVSDIAA